MRVESQPVMMEPLEERRLLSGRPYELQSHGALVVSGAADVNSYNVWLKSIHHASFFVVRVNSSTWRIPARKVKRIVIDRQSRRDQIKLHIPNRTPAHPHQFFHGRWVPVIIKRLRHEEDRGDSSVFYPDDTSTWTDPTPPSDDSTDQPSTQPGTEPSTDPSTQPSDDSSSPPATDQGSSWSDWTDWSDW